MEVWDGMYLPGPLGVGLSAWRRSGLDRAAFLCMKLCWDPDDVRTPRAASSFGTMEPKQKRFIHSNHSCDCLGSCNEGRLDEFMTTDESTYINLLS